MINGFTAAAFKNKKSNYQYTRDKEAADEAKKEPFKEEILDRIDGRDRRWSWVEVDRSAIQHNVMATRRLLPNATRLLAVVKADAYGHGAVDVAKTAVTSGATYLGVATVERVSSCVKQICVNLFYFCRNLLLRQFHFCFITILCLQFIRLILP